MDAIRFNKLPVEEKVPQVMYVDVLPISTISENAPIEFLVPGSGAQYISLADTKLYVKCHIVQGDGSPLPSIPINPEELVPDAARVGPVNNFLHSLWRQPDVFWGDRLVSSSGLNYPYKSYIDVLLNNDTGAKQSQLQAQMFYKETAFFMADVDPIAGGNSGFQTRHEFFKESHRVDMQGPLYVDVFQGQSSMLLNGVDMRLKLWPSMANFNLMSAWTTPSYKVVLDRVLLRICKVTVSPTVFLNHQKHLQTSTAKYPYMKAELTTRAIETLQTSVSMENLFQGRIPAKLCVALLPTASYNGQFRSNPFDFKSANLNYLATYVNGISMPGSPFEPSFPTDNYIREYLSLFSAAGKLGEDSGNDISRQDYAGGYTLYCFDIDPEAQFTLKKQTGNFKVDIRLQEGENEPLTILLYALYPEVIEIDQTRNVLPSS